jgi:hypothetical protein
MIKSTVDRIWDILRKYEDRLTFEERSDIVCELNDLFDEVKKSTPDFDRLMTLESEVLRHDEQLKQLETKMILTYNEHQGQIVELLDQVRNLKNSHNIIETSHYELRRCIEEFATNVYQKLM